MAHGTRQRLADTIGLAVILLALLDLLRPSLLLLPTITAGGDTPCHYPTAVWFHERLLPALRLHGWYPGAYLGQPLLLYYFPLPFLLISALAVVTGLPVAFKLGTVLGVFLLPLLVYASFRLMRLPFPAPLLGAAASLVFLFVEDNPIWGGTIASTLTGEFAYTYGVGLAVLFLGVVARARDQGRGPWGPAVVLALVASAHGYAVLWAGVTASALLSWDLRPRRTLIWLLAVAGIAFCLAAPFLVPLLADWSWTTPYDDPWISVWKASPLNDPPPVVAELLDALGSHPWLSILLLASFGSAWIAWIALTLPVTVAVGLATAIWFVVLRTTFLPEVLWPFFAAAAVGVLATLTRRLSRSSGWRVLLFGYGALVGAALAAAGPAVGVIDVRFVPFAQLSLALAGAAALGLGLSRLARADLAALGLVLLAVVHADASSRVLRYWVDWNYSGLEAKELWPAWSQLNERLRGDATEPRVAVEYGAVHERAGSIRMYETLPFFSGRSTLEGVYNQASLMTHPVYYLASELFASSPNPFRGRTYSRFDPETALARLRLFNVGEIVATSPELVSALDAREDVVREARIPPYTLYRLRDPGPGYVEPLAYTPVRAPFSGWRDAAYRWISSKPPSRAPLVFTDDPRFDLAVTDTWAPPPAIPLPGGVEVEATIEDESIRIHTSRPGHPLLVKVSYHPRWRADGADGPWLVSPGLMLLVPRQADVHLRYAARAWSDALGWGLGGVAVIAGLVVTVRRRRRGPPASGESVPLADGGEGGGWIRVLPLVLVVVLAAMRLAPAPSPSLEVADLDERASRAFAEERWEAAAAYAGHAAARLQVGDPRWAELHCVRGEALVRAGHPREALAAFTEVVDRAPGDPHRPQALYSGALAREATGDAAGAGEWRRWLAQDFPGNPWAERLEGTDPVVGPLGE